MLDRTMDRMEGLVPQENVRMEIIWKAPNISDADLEALYKKYPVPRA